MKFISGKDINIGIMLVILVVATFVIGITKWPFFLLSAIFLFLYIRIDKKRLRCPNCGDFENLERLVSAKKHNYHCRHCGEKINLRSEPYEKSYSCFIFYIISIWPSSL